MTRKVLVTGGAGFIGSDRRAIAESLEGLRRTRSSIWQPRGAPASGARTCHLGLIPKGPLVDSWGFPESRGW